MIFEKSTIVTYNQFAFILKFLMWAFLIFGGKKPQVTINHPTKFIKNPICSFWEKWHRYLQHSCYRSYRSLVVVEVANHQSLQKLQIPNFNGKFPKYIYFLWSIRKFIMMYKHIVLAKSSSFNIVSILAFILVADPRCKSLLQILIPMDCSWFRYETSQILMIKVNGRSLLTINLGMHW